MPSATNEVTPDLRRATRFPVDFDTVCETRSHGEFPAKVKNVSAHGCMIVHDVELKKGDRLIVRLPIAGRIEAFLVWSHEGRSGFEFERVIRQPDFMAMIDTIGVDQSKDPSLS